MNPTYAVISQAGPTLFQYLYRPLDRREELYDLSTDANEHRNLAASAAPSLIGAFRTQLDEYRNQQ